MSAAILAIGNEVVSGQVVNTNAAWLAEQLTEMGVEVAEVATVLDDCAQIAETLLRLCKKHTLVVCTGGLGPTPDDLTAEAIALACKLPLETHKEALRLLEEKLRARGRTLVASQAKQADLPSGARMLCNPVGTAPGFLLVHEGVRVVSLPGVPAEMKLMFTQEVRPQIADLAQTATCALRLQTYGMPESAIVEKLADVAWDERLYLGYRVRFPEVELKLSLKAENFSEAEKLVRAAAVQIRERLGDAVYGEDDDTLAGALGAELRRRHLTVAVAESCTGGLVGEMLTEVPGSSDYLLLDAVTYSNMSKTNVLGVQTELLRAHGAVSAQVARAMAEGARKLVDADLAVSITGIAGPGGGSDEKPVGTVWFGLALKEAETKTEVQRFHGDRRQVRIRAAYHALHLLRGHAPPR